MPKIDLTLLKMNIISGHFLLFFVFSLYGVSSSRVFELSDKFVEISEEGIWFVKFYAPWCAHCRRLEPVWAHVAQALYNTPIRVAKADCTRFTNIASHFRINVFPTIMFIQGSTRHVFQGERTKDEMVKFAMRMAQPSVQKLSETESFGLLKEAHDVFFGYIGKQQGPLWDMYVIQAAKYQPHSWFYSMTHEMVKNDLNPSNDSNIFVCNGGDIYYFEAAPHVVNDKEALNTSLDRWINAERFGHFPKITSSNLHHMMDTGKYIVIVVVAENKLSEITQTERDFKEMVQEIFWKRKNELRSRFQFGWMGSPDIANSIAMSELTVPHLLVLNSTTNHYHIPDDDPVLMTPEAVSIFLDQVHSQMAPTYGGNSWLIRINRSFFESRTALINMWRGNPILTTLVFGLPLGFLSLIFYSICCADILDADEEDESGETHEKKD